MVKNAFHRFRKSELIRGGALAFVIKMFGMLSAYIFTYLVTSNFGAEAWGIFSLALAVLIISSIVGMFGTDIASMRLISKFITHNDQGNIVFLYRKVIFIVLILSFSIGLLIYQLSDFIALVIFSNSDLIPAVKMFAFGVLPFSIIGVNSQNFRALKQIGKYSFFSQVARYFFSAILISVIIYFGLSIVLDALQAVFVFSISLYLAAILSTTAWLYQLKKYRNTPIINRLKTKELFSYSLPQIPTTAMVFINGWLDGIMLGIFGSEFIVGIYNVTLKVANVLKIPSLAMNAISGAQISRAYYENDYRKIQNVSVKSTKVIFFTVLPALIILIIFRQSILKIFGEEFVQAQNALILLAGGFFISSYIGPVGQILTMSGKQKYINVIQIITVFANILINIWLIPKFGFMGAAIAATFSNVFLELGKMFLVIYFYKVRTFYIPFVG